MSEALCETQQESTWRSIASQAILYGRAALTVAFFANTAALAHDVYEEASSLQDCSAAESQPDFDTFNVDQLREEVASMAFGVSAETYRQVRQDIDDAQSKEELTGIMDALLEPMGLAFVLDGNAQQDYGLASFDSSMMDHTPSEDPNVYKIGAKSIVHALAVLPASLVESLEGTTFSINNDLYATGASANGLYAARGSFLSLSGMADTSTVLHEIGHAIDDRLCSKLSRGGSFFNTHILNAYEDDEEWLADNAEDTYSSSPTQQRKSYLYGYVIDEYGANSRGEDVATIFAGIFNGADTYRTEAEAPIVMSKAQLLIERVAEIDSQFAAYSAYLGFIADPLNADLLPQERAAQAAGGDPYYECFPSDSNVFMEFAIPSIEDEGSLTASLIDPLNEISEDPMPDNESFYQVAWETTTDLPPESLWEIRTQLQHNIVYTLSNELPDEPAAELVGTAYGYDLRLGDNVVKCDTYVLPR